MGSPEDFAAMLDLFADGVRPVVDRVFSLRDAAAAAQHLLDANQFGKVVLKVDG
jgi:zinc-binding alcohol dehydrogenase/oxidoreductase